MPRNSLDGALLNPMVEAIRSYIRAQVASGNVPRQLDVPCGDGYRVALVVTQTGTARSEPRRAVTPEKDRRGYYMEPDWRSRDDN